MSKNRPADLDERCLPPFEAVLDNKYGQNPCRVARILTDLPQCQWQDDGYYDLPPLDLENNIKTYPPPRAYQATSCLCSMAVYNLVQACAACQQQSGYTASLWTNWVANCTMSNINGGKTFPYDIPDETALPDWACVNNAGGALSVGQVFRHATGGNMSWPASSAFSSSTTTSPSSTAAGYTEAAASKTLSKIDTPSDDASSGGGGASTKIIAVVVPLVAVAAVVGAVLAYLRRKRKFRRRGHRLDSQSDLPASGESLKGGEAATAVHLAGGSLMAQKESRTSLFVPSESVFTRGSGRSFATNSISTGAEEPFRRTSTMYSPSTGFDTITQSTDFTYDDGRSYTDYDQDDDSISPFSDIHRPAPSRVTTRNNIHSPSFRRSVSTFSGSIHLSESGHSYDARSLLTMSSRGAPPSSSGATYGGVHDDDASDDDDTDAYDGASVRSRR
ncbi:hypothetical protein JCM6882_000844 [Rhodosporidiobolus microsporus]